MKDWVGFIVACENKSPSKRDLRVERCQAVMIALREAPRCWVILTLTVNSYLILDFKILRNVIPVVRVKLMYVESSQ